MARGGPSIGRASEVANKKAFALQAETCIVETLVTKTTVSFSQQTSRWLSTLLLRFRYFH
jgi:hypothetical protein